MASGPVRGGVGVVVPVLSLVRWLVSGIVHKVPFAPVFEPAMNTLMYASIGALVVLIIGLAPAYVTSSRGGRKASLLETLVYLTSSVRASSSPLDYFNFSSV